MASRINPVAWTEGMFLRPQHLQQHDRSAEERLRYHLQWLNPFHWGVRELAFDEEALAGGRVVVTRLEAVLRDGTPVRLGESATIASRKLEPGRERIDVHLALGSWSETDPNVSDGESGPRHARHRIATMELPDLTRGGPRSPVEVLEPNLRLLLSGEENELGLYESLKLAEIEATDESKRAYALSSRYVPPLLAMQASPVLQEAFTRITSQVVARVRAAAAATKTLTMQSVPRLFMRYALARAAPLLRHLQSTGETPPFLLYSALVELAGGLAFYRLEEAADLPLYDHENLEPCFRGVIDFIAAELDRLAPDNFDKLPMPFEPAIQAYATKSMSMEMVDPRNSFYLAVRAPIEEQQLRILVVEQGKASSPRKVPMLVRGKVPGVPLEKLPGPPTEIESMAGYVYYRLDARHREWSSVREDLSFAIHILGLQNASVFLYVARMPEPA